MVGDRPLQHINHAWPVDVIVDRTEHAAGCDGDHAHPKLAPRHAVDLGTKIHGRQRLDRNASGFKR
jgi:hypothetical protein